MKPRRTFQMFAKIGLVKINDLINNTIPDPKSKNPTPVLGKNRGSCISPGRQQQNLPENLVRSKAPSLRKNPGDWTIRSVKTGPMPFCRLLRINDAPQHRPQGISSGTRRSIIPGPVSKIRGRYHFLASNNCGPPLPDFNQGPTQRASVFFAGVFPVIHRRSMLPLAEAVPGAPGWGQL